MTILWLFQSLLSAVTNKNIDFLGDDDGQIWSLDISIWKPHYHVKLFFSFFFLNTLKVEHWTSAWAMDSAVADIRPGFGFTLVDTVAIEALSTAQWSVAMSVLWVSINTESPQCDHDKTCMIS